MHRLVQLTAAVASLASIGQAFRVPPSVPASVLDSVSLDPLHFAEDVSVAIDCPGCPVSTRPYSADTQSALRFNISLSHDKHGDALLLNGFQAYPFAPLSDVFNKRPLAADQLVKTSSGNWEFADSPDIGWAITTIAPTEAAEHANPLNIVKMRVQVLDVGGRPVNGMFVLEIKLLETPSRALMLGEVQVVPPPARSPSNGCTTLICAWRAFIKDKISKMKTGCGGMRRPHHGQTKNPAHVNAHGGHDHPHRPHHSFQPHHHHHNQTGFMRYLRIAVVRILIPVMFGIVFGATACVVGIVTGHLAVCVWRAIFRRGERATYIRAESDDASDDDDEDDNDETKGFLKHQDAPPVYEHAPVYEEVPTTAKASE